MPLTFDIVAFPNLTGGCCKYASSLPLIILIVALEFFAVNVTIDAVTVFLVILEFTLIFIAILVGKFSLACKVIVLKVSFVLTKT